MTNEELLTAYEAKEIDLARWRELRAELLRRLASAVPAGPADHVIDVAVARIAQEQGWALPDADLIEFGATVYKEAIRMVAPSPAGLKDFSVEKALEEFPEKEPQPTVYSPADPGEQFKLQQGFAPVVEAKVEEVADKIATTEFCNNWTLVTGVTLNPDQCAAVVKFCSHVLRPYLQVNQPPTILNATTNRVVESAWNRVQRQWIKIGKLEGELKSHVAKISNQKDEIKRIQENAAKLRAERDALEQRLIARGEAVKSLESGLDTAEAEVVRLKAVLEILQLGAQPTPKEGK